MECGVCRGHGKIKAVIADQIFDMLIRDEMSAEVSFRRRFEAFVTGRSEWRDLGTARRPRKGRGWNVHSRSWARSECAKVYFGGKLSKYFLPAPCDSWARELLGLDRSSIRGVARAITGLCRLNKNLSRMKPAVNPACASSFKKRSVYVVYECAFFLPQGLEPWEAGWNPCMFFG